MEDEKARSLDLSGTHSWDEVMRLVKDTEAAYQEAGRNSLRKTGRRVAQHSVSVLPYLRLIPNGYYTSIVCGGLKVVFELSFCWSMSI